MLECLGKQPSRLVEVVPGDAEQHGLTSGGQHLAVGSERIGVADLPGSQRLARQPELAAGGEDGDPRAAGDGDAVAAHRRQKADLGGAEEGAAGKKDVAHRDVLGGAPHVGARLHRLPHDKHLAVLLGVLHLHHGVDPWRQRSAGHDLGGLTGADLPADPATGGYVHDDAELAATGLKLGATHGVTVHRRVVERRHGLGRDDRGRRGAPERLEERLPPRPAAGAQRRSRCRGLRGC